MYVIDYIEENYDDIEKDMEARNIKKTPNPLKKESQKGKKKANTIAICPAVKETTESQKISKRREISESALKTIHHFKNKSIVSFD